MAAATVASAKSVGALKVKDQAEFVGRESRGSVAIGIWKRTDQQVVAGNVQVGNVGPRIQ